MRRKSNRSRWIVAWGALAALAPLAVAGKPGGSAPPADPEIVCVNSGRQGKELVVMNADGTNTRTLVSTSGVALSSGDWSPDGSRIAFMYGGPQGPGVYVVNRDGTGISRVVPVDATTDPDFWWSHTPRWSPAATADGASKIAYVTTHVGGTSKSLWFVGVDGSGATQVTTSAPQAHRLWGVVSVAWSPGADRLVTGNHDSASGSARDDLVLHTLGLVGGTLAVTSSANLTDDGSVPGGTLNGRRVTSPSWSRTGNRIAVDASPAPASGEQYNVWVIDLMSPATPSRVSPSPTVEQTDPCWSQDDTELVVHTVGSLYVMSADGGGLAQIAKGSRSAGTWVAPTWRRTP